jgi:hypothetical protein
MGIGIDTQRKLTAISGAKSTCGIAFFYLSLRALKIGTNKQTNINN